GGRRCPGWAPSSKWGSGWGRGGFPGARSILSPAPAGRFDGRYPLRRVRVDDVADARPAKGGTPQVQSSHDSAATLGILHTETSGQATGALHRVPLPSWTVCECQAAERSEEGSLH